MRRVNNPEACICCGRRADGLAVGQPNKLGWYCRECGPDAAKKALYMLTRDWDVIERRAAEQIAKEVAHGEDLAGVPLAELPGFVLWIIDRFAQTMRDEIQNGGAPF